MSQKIGSISINLEAGIASFVGDMGKAKELAAKTANDVKRSFEQIKTAAVALLAGEASHALLEMSYASIEAMASIGKLAQAAGTSTETMSRLGVAARLTGTPIEDVAGSMEKLAKSAFGAETGNKALSKVFSKLGVDVKNGNGGLKDTGAIMLDVSKALEKYQDDAGKTAILQQLFGKSGAAMNPMLHEMAMHWSEVTDMAGRFGLVLSGKTAAAADETAQGFKRLQMAGEGAFQTLMASAMPALQQLTAQMERWSQQEGLASKLNVIGPEVVHGIEIAAKAMEFVVDHAHQMKVALEVVAGLEVFRIFGPFALSLSAATAPMKVLGEGTEKFIQAALGSEDVTKSLKGVWVSMREGTAVLQKLYETETFIPVATRGMNMAFGSTLGIIGAVTAGVAALVGQQIYEKEQADKLAHMDVGWTRIWAADVENLEVGFRSLATAIAGVIEVSAGFGSQGWKDFKASDAALRGEKTVGERAAASVQAYTAAMKPTAGYQGASDAADGFMKQFVAAHKKGLANVNVEDFQKELKEKVQQMYSLPDQEKRAIVARETDFFADAIKNSKASLGTAGLGAGDKKQSAEQLMDQQKAKIIELAGAQTRLTAAVGLYGGAQQQANAANVAARSILEINKKLLEEQLPALTKPQEKIIEATAVALGQASAEHALREALEQGTHSADLRAQSAARLTLAITAGQGAMRQAAIDNEKLQISSEWAKLLPEYAQYVDEWNKNLDNASIKEAIREHAQITAGIRDSIEAQRIENGALGQGVFSMEKARNAAILYALALKLVDERNDEVRKGIEDQIAATKAQQDAKGSDSVRSAMEALTPPAVKYRDTISAIDLALEDMKRKTTDQSTLAIQGIMAQAQAYAAFQSELKSTVDTLLAQNNALAGAGAFFLEYQNSAKTAAQATYSAFRTAFAGIEDNLASLIVKGKADFHKFFEDMAMATTKNALHMGMSSLMKVTHLGDLSKPDGSAGKPLWVQIASGVSGLDGNPTVPQGGMMAGLSKLLGSFGGAFASGGDPDPNKFSLVGEEGPELLHGGRVYSNAQSRRMLSGGGGANYTIYADGAAAAEVEMRVQRALAQVHGSAIQGGAAVTQERMRRMPRSAFGR